MHRFPFWGLNSGIGWIGGAIFLGLLVAIFVLLIVLLVKRKETTQSYEPASYNIHARIMEILKVNYEAKYFDIAEYEERRMILDGGSDDDYTKPELILLKEKYARGDVDSREYCEKRTSL